MRIRPASARDAAAVASLWTEGYTNRGPGGRKTPYTEAEFFDSAREGQIYVVDGAGQGGSAREEEIEDLAGSGLAGVVVFRPPAGAGRDVAGAQEAEISRLVVAERVRGGGVGGALVELCAELAREAGAEALALWSRPYQVAAHRLYESQGYRRAPERDSTDADGDRLVFVKQVTP